jgi:hypothetical protein
MISYIPIKVNNLDIIKNEIIDFSKTLFDISKKCRVKLDIEKVLSLTHVHSMLKEMNMIEHLAMIYIFTIEPGYKTEVHVDIIKNSVKLENLSYNFLIPLFGYEESFRNYYSLKNGAQGIDYKDIVTYYNIEDCILDKRIRTTYPTLHNIKYPHSFENLSQTNHRSMCSFRLKNTYTINYKFVDIGISPYESSSFI